MATPNDMATWEQGQKRRVKVLATIPRSPCQPLNVWIDGVQGARILCARHHYIVPLTPDNEATNSAICWTCWNLDQSAAYRAAIAERNSRLRPFEQPSVWMRKDNGLDEGLAKTYEASAQRQHPFALRESRPWASRVAEQHYQECGGDANSLLTCERHRWVWWITREFLAVARAAADKDTP